MIKEPSHPDAARLLDHKKEVPATFDKIARRYNLATSLSQGYSIDLQRSVRLMQLKGNEYVLDLCCGTGKSTLQCLQAVPHGKVLAIDNSKEMLQVARETVGNIFTGDHCRFMQQDVMELDLPDSSVDAIFMAYGLRNMPDYKTCLLNLRRILKPGGRLLLHEFSLPENAFHRVYWRLLGYGLILPFSAMVTGNVTIFNYLIKSVTNFLSPESLQKLLADSGFENISASPQRSWRRFILYTFIADKPGNKNT